MSGNDRYGIDFGGPMLPAMLHAMMLARNTAFCCQDKALMDAFQEKFDALAAQAGIPGLLRLVDERAWFAACNALRDAKAYHWFEERGWRDGPGLVSLVVDGREFKVAGRDVRADHPQLPAIQDFLERYAHVAAVKAGPESSYYSFAELQARRNPKPAPEPKPDRVIDLAAHIGHDGYDEELDGDEYDEDLEGEFDPDLEGGQGPHRF